MVKRRRMLFSIVAVVILPLAGLGVYWAMQPEPAPGITLENFRRIHRGMTVAQVEAVLGFPHDAWAGDSIMWMRDDVIIALDLDN